MAEWIVCPSCNLHHSVRPTRICPRCKASVDGLAAPPADVTVIPAPEAPPGDSMPRVAVDPARERRGPAPAEPSGAWGCANHPAVTENLVSCRRCGRRFCADCVVLLRGAFYCTSCKGELVRDLQSGVQPGALELASIGRRFGALFVDNFVTMIGMYAILIPAAFLVAAAAGSSRSSGENAPPPVALALMMLLYAIAFAVPLVYEALMLGSRGQTLGKMALGVKVVSADGSDISAGQAWARAALKLVLSCAAITFWSALFTEEKTTLHDMIVGTRVVRLQ